MAVKMPVGTHKTVKSIALLHVREQNVTRHFPNNLLLLTLVGAAVMRSILNHRLASSSTGFAFATMFCSKCILNKKSCDRDACVNPSKQS